MSEIVEHNELALDSERLPAITPDPVSPELAIIRMAVEKGGDVSAAMKTLYDLKVAEREHAARLAYNRALAAFQAECPPVPKSSRAEIKTRTGANYGYAYADFEQIVETISPHLRAHGLSFSFDSASGANTLTCTCSLRHVEGYSERSSFELPTASASAMSEQQKVGAALTFAKRQALTAILGLALTDPDPDAGADPSTITEDQAANLRALIQEVGANEAKVLAYANAPNVDAIRAADFERVVKALEAKRKK